MQSETFHDKSLAEINIVPYVDVMLVLLVIFMITAPMVTLTQSSGGVVAEGIPVNLPDVSAPTLSGNTKPPAVITIDAAGAYYLDLHLDVVAEHTLDSVISAVMTIHEQEPGRGVMIRGDSDVSYGSVVNLMAKLQASGVKNVGLVTKIRAQEDE